jgi:hypothetical protein
MPVLNPVISQHQHWKKGKNWTYSGAFNSRTKTGTSWVSPSTVCGSSKKPTNEEGMIIKPVVIIQMKRVERELCHLGTVPKLSSICIYGDKPSFEPFLG